MQTLKENRDAEQHCDRTGRGLCKLYKGQIELRLSSVLGLEFVHLALGMQIQGQGRAEQD